MQEAQVAEVQIPTLASAHFLPKQPLKQPRERRPLPPAADGRPRSPVNGQPVPKGRAKGTPNKVTQTLREAVEMAAKDCHPHGLAGWLVERAQGGVQDRQIFAGLVGKVIPIQVNQSVQGGISINLNWLGGRAIGTVSAQPKVIDAQTVELIEDSDARRWTTDATSTPDAADADAGKGQKGLQGADAVSGYLAPTEPAIASPEPVSQALGPSPRAPGPDPLPPFEPAGGAGAQAGAPSPHRHSKK